MRRLGVLAVAALPLAAHVMSFSSGDITVNGNRAHYELRMPLYEIAHVKNAEAAILGAIRFTGGGGEARRVSGVCREESDAYLCRADYEFPRAVDRLEVECRFHDITVPNHVHLLRAARGDKRDQALFDLSFPTAALRFEPPGPVEVAFTRAASGAGRAFTPVQLLFLAGLVLAARSRRELLALAGMFFAGQVAAALIVPRTSWYPAARFVEAAAALTVAYLAVEILLLPKAGSRWAVAAVLGGFHGLYFALFLRTSEYDPGWVMAGGVAAQALLLAVLAVVLGRVARAFEGLRPVPVGAGVLLAAGSAWFIARMAG